MPSPLQVPVTFFHKLDKKGYEDEMKRHNLAMEQLTAAKEKWYEKTVEKKNKIALLQQKLLDANKDLDDTNEALHNLRTVMDEESDQNQRWTIITNHLTI